MLECISSVVMYAKLLNIIKGSIDPSKEGLLISMLPHSLIYPWILSICPLLRKNSYIFWYSPCEASNFTVAAPMKTATAPEICNIIMNHFIGYFGTPIRIVCDQDPAFMSHLCQWFLHSYGIHVTTASPTNHQSLWLSMNQEFVTHINETSHWIR